MAAVRLKSGEIKVVPSSGTMEKAGHSERLAMQIYGDDIEELYTERIPCPGPKGCAAAMSGLPFKVSYSFDEGEEHARKGIRSGVSGFMRRGFTFDGLW
ncbi:MULTISPECIES: nucleic acid/nucleotide deaminase domain-containing protein [Catenuloplanes]|uniref:nucleic acid/nucleotide deaminase domain-containing protein n=1 Tax=Catenuloplanes TaxID=33874 RepID=UPI0035B4FCF9